MSIFLYKCIPPDFTGLRRAGCRLFCGCFFPQSHPSLCEVLHIPLLSHPWLCIWPTTLQKILVQNLLKLVALLEVLRALSRLPLARYGRSCSRTCPHPRLCWAARSVSIYCHSRKTSLFYLTTFLLFENTDRYRRRARGWRMCSFFFLFLSFFLSCPALVQLERGCD